MIPKTATFCFSDNPTKEIDLNNSIQTVSLRTCLTKQNKAQHSSYSVDFKPQISFSIPQGFVSAYFLIF